MTSRPAPSQFRQRLASGETLVGTFIKTPTSHATEILGDMGFDFVVIDEEHAPFDRAQTDAVLLAARAAGTAGIVRVPDASPSGLLSVLDCGAIGVLVPHVATAAKARDVVAACRYRGGKRGFSASPRAGRYGAVPMWQHVEAMDAQTTVVAMIEDPEALDEIDAIAAVEGLDAFFIGRGDLTVAFGAPSQEAPVVKNAVERIVAAAKKNGKAVCAMIGRSQDAPWLRDLGVTAFIVSTDQGFLRAGAQAALEAFKPYRNTAA